MGITKGALPLYDAHSFKKVAVYTSASNVGSEKGSQLPRGDLGRTGGQYLAQPRRRAHGALKCDPAPVETFAL
eukprot:1972586-Pyramimonas_sp.AAC.1